ncbi:DNA photolyase [Gracilaria domingensis]|nr:DNA photolyase [Gracilaria domingensis]
MPRVTQKLGVVILTEKESLGRIALGPAFAQPSTINWNKQHGPSWCSAFDKMNRTSGRGRDAYQTRGRGRRHRAPNLRASIDPFVGPKVLKRELPKSLSPDSVAVLWLRNDLRVRDNEALVLANTANIFVPVYVFDLSKFGIKNASPWGFQRNGPFRTVFLIESVKDMQQSLRVKGNDLLIRQGSPVEEVLDVVKSLVKAGLGPVNVVAHKESTWEETRDENAIEEGLKKQSEETGVEIKMHWVWGSTMHHVDDVPFNPGGPALPKTFTAYRKLVEGRQVPVRKEIPTPERLKLFPLHLRLRKDPFPTLRQDLQVEGLCDPLDYAFPHPLGAMDFVGGESKGLKRMKVYFWNGFLEEYKKTRNESGRRNSSSKFSSWLSLGCLSPRTLYWEVKEFENKKEANDSTYWMIFELMTRDYFRWVSASVGTKLFALNGYTGRSSSDKSIFAVDITTMKPFHRERLRKWIEGKTGAPFIDASMRELALTGFMSNRGRQNVASFLIHDLEFPDWRAGAEYFESILIDHDVASNWGNWAYLAGVGSDPRGGRKFNVIKQSIEYDPNGWFIQRWCPELVDLPAPMIHEPHKLPPEALKDIGIIKGETYPNPIVPLPEAPVTQDNQAKKTPTDAKV